MITFAQFGKGGSGSEYMMFPMKEGLNMSMAHHLLLATGVEANQITLVMGRTAFIIGIVMVVVGTIGSVMLREVYTADQSTIFVK